MREIKFRARCAFSGVWRHGYYYQSKGNHIIRDKDDKESIVLQKTVGQFIGLHDKNGKEIYEEDVLGKSVKDVNKKDTMLCYRVTFNEGAFKLDVSENQNGKLLTDLKYYLENGYTIIGNIYDTKDF